MVQSVGHLTVNEDGEGSNPSAPANFFLFSRCESAFEGLRQGHLQRAGLRQEFPLHHILTRELASNSREVGLSADQYTALASPNGLCLEMEITATKKP